MVGVEMLGSTLILPVCSDALSEKISGHSEMRYGFVLFLSSRKSITAYLLFVGASLQAGRNFGRSIIRA